MKKLLLFFTLIIIISCKNDANDSKLEEERVIPKLNPISVDYENFEPSNTNLTSWLFVFSTSPDGKGNMDRIKLYTSEEDFTKDTKEKFAKIWQLEGVDHVAKEMIYRLKKKMDFQKEDLIVVRMLKQKETDTLGYYQKENTIYFCLDKSEKLAENNENEIIKFFKVPKGFTVDNCKPGLYDKDWQLKEIINGDKKTSFKLNDLIVNFNPAARCDIRTKCLKTQSSFTQNDSELTLKYFQKGKINCQDQQSTTFIDYLKEVKGFVIENNQLHLILDANSGKMIFE